MADMKNDDVGKNFRNVSINPQSEITRAIYEKYNPVIADAISRRFPEQSTLSCLELGGGAGALVKEVKKLLPGKNLVFTNVDRSEELLKADAYSEHKILQAIEDIDPHVIGKFDVILVRYVLNYNNPDNQKRIIGKIKELLKPSGIFILHHVGAGDSKHKSLLNKLFSTDVVSKKLLRSQPYWTTWQEQLNCLHEASLTTTVLTQYNIPIGSLYKERYELTNTEEEKLHTFLGKYDFYEYVISESVL